MPPVRTFAPSRQSSPVSRASPSQAGEASEGLLKRSLQIAKNALNRLPLSGANGIIRGVLDVITRLEVSH